MSIVGITVDMHCDDGCERDSHAVVVADENGRVVLERTCCHAEVELRYADFRQLLED